MTTKISILSQSPYFDDFDPSKDFVRVLFRPSYPVQARELTTLQSFLQDQITRFGDHLFKDGSRVTGGSITISNDVVRLEAKGENSTTFPASGAVGAVVSSIYNLQGLTITNSTGTVKARVVKQPSIPVSQTSGNLYVKYVTNETFDPAGDYLYALPEDNPGLTTTLYTTYEGFTPCTLASIASGVYYVKGVFVRVNEQTVVVDTLSASASADLGFSVTETIITQSEDATLFDNARGTTNEGSPGAHRMKINLSFVAKPIGDDTDENFYRVLTTNEGNITGTVEVSEQYAGLMDTLARRTYDESGHYALKPFTHAATDSSNKQVFDLTIGPSKAYVKGYEITKNFATKLEVDKGLSDTASYTDYKIPFVGTSSVVVTSVSGILPGQNGGDPQTPANRLLLRNGAGNIIGIAKGHSVINEVQNGVSVNRLYMFDIKMFTVITTSDGVTFFNSVSEGNDVSSGKARAIVYKTDTHIAAGNLILLNAVGRFRVNQTITSNVNGASSTIASVTTFSTSDIASVVGSANAFAATVTSGTFANGNSQLVMTAAHRIKTFKDANGVITDNDFTVVFDASVGGGTLTPLLSSNGIWQDARVDNGNEIKKVLKFKYIKVRNVTPRTSINYGWVAQDKEVSLYYPDIHRVYKINQSTGANETVAFDGARFDRINITTTAIIPQGALITGVTSGTTAIVALSNSSATGSGSLGGGVYHKFIENTGSSSVLEVIYQTGSSFTANENLTVRLLDTTAVPINNSVTYLSSVSPTGQDVTGMYLLDDGQRAEYYDTGRLYRKDNLPAPTNDIVVFFSYFESVPDAQRHYFNADSYGHLDLFDVDVRFYEELQDIAPKTRSTGRNLRDSIDFRFQVLPVTNTAVSPFGFGGRVYRKQGRVFPNRNFTTDFTEYLGRIDVLMLTKDGDFVFKKGIPSTKPKRPEDIPDAMTLSTLNIPPVVRYAASEVGITINNNRRYTMADIGKLDERITNVEQAVALSMLESQALHDDVDGRTKMGFIVDDFSTDVDGNSPADFRNKEFRSSIDTINRNLIPAQTAGKPVSMEITGTTNTSSFFPDYVINSFVEETLADQSKATSTYAINPFAVWLYKGQLRLTPSEDNWHIRSDNYFINRFGRLEPVSAAEFTRFGQITTNSPGGASSTVREWVGASSTTVVSTWSDTAAAAAAELGVGLAGGRTHITRQAQQTITTRTFEAPRASGAPVETFNGTTVIENPQDYMMRSVTVAFSCSGLRPNTTHTGYFGGVQVLTGLVSDANGQLAGSFVIPANTFPAGTREFELKDTDTQVQSTAAAGFRSIGHVDHFTQTQNTAISVATSSIQEGVLRRLDFSDPVAQLFMLPISNDAGQPVRESAILTSVDLWFGFVDIRPTMDKVLVEIREAVNGYPGGPDKIIGTTGFVTLTKSNQVGIPSPTNKTNIKFIDPVSLVSEKEYAIVIKSPSDATTVFVAKIGEKLLNGSGIHDAQPLVGGYAGSFFKSQNSSTWEADQNVDLTFKLYRAKFEVGTIGSVTLANTVSNDMEFNGDIGAFNEGLALETFTNSQYVKVIHPNHGLNFDGAKVRLSGFGTATYNGIPGSEINADHNVYFATIDSYFVKVSTVATASGRPPVPMFTTFATQCLVYDSMITNINITRREADAVVVRAKTFTTNSVNLRTDGVNKLVTDGILVPVPNDFINIPLAQKIDFDEPRIVRNLLNATGSDLQMTLAMTSGTDYTSPYFKRGTNFNPILFRNAVGTSMSDSDIASGLNVRSVILGDDENNQKHASYIAGVHSETEFSAYVTREIQINLPADGFTIFIDADMEPESVVEFAYKVRPVGDEQPFDDLQWVDFPVSQRISEANYGPFSSDTSRTSFTARATTPFEFTSFKIRIRFRVRNEARIPKLRDLRILADM